MSKIFIGGLNGTVQEMDIAILVSLYCDLKAVKIVRDRKTGKCKGYAFIETASEKDAANVIEALDGQKFQSNFITVKEMEVEPVKPKPNKWIPKKTR